MSWWNRLNHEPTDSEVNHQAQIDAEQQRLLEEARRAAQEQYERMQEKLRKAQEPK